MATLQQKYNELEGKMHGVIARINEYQHIINKLKRENEALRRQAAAATEEAAQWKNKHQMLGATQSILKKEDKNELKKEINQLVREIDYCIGYINSK